MRFPSENIAVLGDQPFHNRPINQNLENPKATVTINVKEKADGEYVYSFNAEKEFSTQRTLHADVNTSKGANGELFLNTIIPQNSEKSTGSAKKSGKLQEEEFGSPEEAKRSGRISDAKFSLKFAPDIAENQRKYYDCHDIVLDEDELDI